MRFCISGAFLWNTLDWPFPARVQPGPRSGYRIQNHGKHRFSRLLAQLYNDQAEHLGILRKVQDETYRFTELVTLPYVHTNTPLYQQGVSRPGPTGREDLLMIAISRLFLDNFDNIQLAWGKIGLKMSQLALLSGANDLAGTMFTDDVSGDAGAAGSDFLDPEDMERIVSDIGRKLRQRTTLYEIL